MTVLSRRCWRAARVWKPFGGRGLHASAALRVMDAPPMPPFDVVVADLDDAMLRRDIATELREPYLAAACATDMRWPAEGKVLGYDRMLISLVVERWEAAVSVIFLVDTGAPATFLSWSACAALGLTEGAVPQHFNVKVHGHTVAAQATPTDPKRCGFVGVNILGADYLRDPAQSRHWRA